VDFKIKGGNDRLVRTLANAIGRKRPSIAPEKLLRALLLQVLYPLRSERHGHDNTVRW